MTIKDLSGIIRSKCPNATKQYPLSCMRGFRVAIDGHNYAYKYMKVACKEYCYSNDIIASIPDRNEIVKIFIMNFIKFIINNFLMYGILPVMILDGSRHPKKVKTHDKRKNEWEKTRNQLDNILGNIQNVSREMISSSIIEEVRKCYVKLISVNQSDLDMIQNILYAIGLPCFRAKHDAEKLCSALCIEGHVIAVLSEDSDNLAHGCPRLITEFGDNFVNQTTGIPDRYVTVIETTNVLTDLNLDLYEFIDMCIMLGCDNNERIRMCGEKKCFDNITKYRNIDNFAYYENVNVSILDHYNCRANFYYTPSHNELNMTLEQLQTLLTFNSNKFIENALDILQQYSIESLLSSLTNFLQAMPEIKNMNFELPARQIKINFVRVN